MRRGSQRPRGGERLRRVSAVGRPLGRGLVHLRNGVSSRVEGIPVRVWLLEAMERSRRDAVAGLSPEAALHARSNFRLGVANGIIYGLANSLIAPGFVLALFVNRLGAPNILVGLIPAIATGGGFLPQILVASRVQVAVADDAVIQGHRRGPGSGSHIDDRRDPHLERNTGPVTGRILPVLHSLHLRSRRLGHSLAGDDKQSGISQESVAHSSASAASGEAYWLCSPREWSPPCFPRRSQA